MAGSGSGSSKAKRRFVIDCDAGLDDSQAILMALADPDVDVIAITTTHGNVGVDQVCRNVLRVLKVAGRLDIPVYKGAAKSLIGQDATHASFYHGKDGLGDVPDPDPPSEDLIQKEHAVPALMRLAEENRGELTLVCLGPLTNTALALRLDQDFGKKLKECYIMGGNYHGVGNVVTCAEFNFHSDPEAAKVTLQELGCPITLASWELCQKHGLSWEWREKISKSTSKKARFFDKLEAFTITTYYKRDRREQLYGTADQLAMAAALNDDVIKEFKTVYCTVETSGELTRGQMVVDWQQKMGRAVNVKLVLAVDHDMYANMMLHGLDVI